MTNMSALTLPEAQRVLLTAAKPLSPELIPTHAALGHVLAEDIVTPRDFPDTRRSAVDGFAVNLNESKQYQITETIGAGEMPQCSLNIGQAAAVMTGATIPNGSRAVVRVEDCCVDNQVLTLKNDVKSLDNINLIGEEMSAGALILKKGTRLSAVQHSVLCCLGLDQVKVHRSPQVGLLITGDEILQLGSDPLPGRVFDSNRHLLAGCLAQLGIKSRIIGPVKDDRETIRNSLHELAEDCDLVISTGGVSMGKYDFIRPLLHSGGFDVLVNKTGIKPGRPLIVARNETSLFFGMPGYPAACLVNFFYYLLPTVKRLMGITAVDPVVRAVSLATDLTGRKGRWDIIRVKLETNDGRERIFKSDSQLTSHFLNFGSCDGLVMLDAETDLAAAGKEMPFLDFSMQF